MEKLYYESTYVKSFKGTVLSCNTGRNGQFEVELDRTAFYPEGGGQPSDRGILGGANVLSVHERDGKILHMTDKPLEAGNTVMGILDWDWRFRNMQQHSGEHIFSGLIHQHFGYDNVGFHMGTDEVTVDFNGLLSWEQVLAVEKEANQVIYDNRLILASYPCEEELHTMDYRSKKELHGEVRIVTIPGADVCACCGTHVVRTGEIGMIKAVGMINYKGGVRVSLLCGTEALADYEKRLEQVRKITHLLSAKPAAIGEAVEKLKKESEKKDGILSRVYGQLFEAKAAALPGSGQPLLLLEKDLGPGELRRLATLLYEQGKGDPVAVCAGQDGAYQYAIGSSKMDMRKASKWLNQQLNGRGGGSALLAQGTWAASWPQIETSFAALREELGERTENSGK